MFNCISIDTINDIHLCADTDYVAAIFRTALRATHVIRAGDLVPESTMLKTPAVDIISHIHELSMTLQEKNQLVHDFHTIESLQYQTVFIHRQTSSKVFRSISHSGPCSEGGKPKRQNVQATARRPIQIIILLVF